MLKVQGVLMQSDEGLLENKHVWGLPGTQSVRQTKIIMEDLGNTIHAV